VDSLPPTLSQPRQESAPQSIPAEGVQLDELVNEFERHLLREALEKAGGVKKRAAHLLGISFRSFRYRLEKLGLDDPHSRGS
jgi:two-component system response regulator PilR (NtrC family)